MSYLNAVGPATQFATTAACDFALKKTNVEKGPLLCTVVSPAVQAAGNYVYQNTLQNTSDVATLHSPSLNPSEQAGAAIFGAYAGYKVLNKVGDAMFNFLVVGQGDKYYPLAMRVNDAQSSSLVRAGMAVFGTKVATHLADVIKQTYSSPSASSTEKPASIVRTEA
jgi:hypothetical protein